LKNKSLPHHGGNFSLSICTQPKRGKERKGRKPSRENIKGGVLIGLKNLYARKGERERVVIKCDTREFCEKGVVCVWCAVLH
jgi:hypothetical protein